MTSFDLFLVTIETRADRYKQKSGEFPQLSSIGFYNLLDINSGKYCVQSV